MDQNETNPAEAPPQRTAEERIDRLTRMATIYYGNPQARSQKVLDQMRTEIAELSNMEEVKNNPRFAQDVQSAKGLLDSAESEQRKAA